MPEQETHTHLVSKFSLTVKTENGNVAESGEWIYKVLIVYFSYVYHRAY